MLCISMIRILLGPLSKDLSWFSIVAQDLWLFLDLDFTGGDNLWKTLKSLSAPDCLVILSGYNQLTITISANIKPRDNYWIKIIRIFWGGKNDKEIHEIEFLGKNKIRNLSFTYVFKFRYYFHRFWVLVFFNLAEKMSPEKRRSKRHDQAWL